MKTQRQIVPSLNLHFEKITLILHWLLSAERITSRKTIFLSYTHTTDWATDDSEDGDFPLCVFVQSVNGVDLSFSVRSNDYHCDYQSAHAEANLRQNLWFIWGASAFAKFAFKPFLPMWLCLLGLTIYFSIDSHTWGKFGWLHLGKCTAALSTTQSYQGVGVQFCRVLHFLSLDLLTTCCSTWAWTSASSWSHVTL